MLVRASANGGPPTALDTRGDVAQRELNPAQTQGPGPNPSLNEGEDALYSGRRRRARPQLRVCPNERLAKDGASNKGGPMAAPLRVEEGEKEERGGKRMRGENANIPKFRLQGTEDRN